MPWRQSYRDGEPYALDELVRTAEGRGDEVVTHLLGLHGIVAVQHMRVCEPSGIAAWLTLTRSKGQFEHREATLLRDLAPTLRGALQCFVRRERENYASALNADAVHRLQFGWITLDANGTVLDFDKQAGDVLATSKVLQRARDGSLRAGQPEVNARLWQAIQQVVQDASSRAHAISLCREPWLDMLVVPARRKWVTTRRAPAAIAYVHGDNWLLVDRQEQLAELFDLSPREAKMALALSRGMSISEAAHELKLTAGSARMYSKLIYAKTGARGLPDLVRIVMRSVLAITPEL